MSRLLLSLRVMTMAGLYLLHPTAAHAILWPVVTSVNVINCQPSESGECGDYTLTGSAAMLELGEPVQPPPGKGAKNSWYGVHCDRGTLETGFKGCYFLRSSHGPSAPDHCPWASGPALSWEISPTCYIPSAWGDLGHTGADVGGECALFGVLVGDALKTPWLITNAESLANSGSAHCVKPIDPIRPCTVGPIAELSHGAVGPNTVDTVDTTVTVSCGGQPSIEVVGGTHVDIAAGVSSQISADMTSPTTLRVESRLTTRGGTPGRYSTSKIVVVSPE